MLTAESRAKKRIVFLRAVFERNAVQIGLAENGGYTVQDGCFFDVHDVEKAFAEPKAIGLEKELLGFNSQKYGEAEWEAFLVVAPDGLCYCYSERQN